MFGLGIKEEKKMEGISYPLFEKFWDDILPFIKENERLTFGRVNEESRRRLISPYSPISSLPSSSSFNYSNKS